MNCKGNKQNNVPRLRFAEFSGEWVEESIKSITSLLKDGSHGTHKNVSNSNYLLLSAKNISDGRINIHSEDRRISEDDFNQIYKNYTLLKGDVLLTIVGTIGRSAIVDNLNNIAFQRSVAFFRFDKCNSDFMYQLFNTLGFQNELNKKKVISAQPGIYLGDLAKILVFYPKDPQEQQKIATFLSSIDKKIEQLTKKKQLLEAYKKGMMQKLFSRQIRFKDENGGDYPDWVEKRLGGDDVAKIKKGQQLNRDDMIDEGSFPVINGGTSESGFTDNSNMPGGVITISEGGNSCGYVAWQEQDFWLGGHCYALIIDKLDVNNMFVFQSLKYKQSEIMRLRVGSGLPNIQKGSLDNLAIDFPHPKEQTKIANFLTSIDEKITQIETKLTKAKTFKKGLLQQMFV